jgi:hypothetical protein
MQIGSKFGLLTVIGGTTEDRRYWLCRCVCGVEKRIRQDHLRSGRTISCGCEHSRRSSARVAALHKANVTHGASNTRAYTTWRSMKSRCLNTRSRYYRYYGGRGITICERWMTFKNFLADMGQPPDGLEIDRINNSGPYSPENCRWSSRTEQQNNRRVNRIFSVNDEAHTIAEWSRITGIHPNTITQRLDRGLPPSEVISPEKFCNITGLPKGIAASAALRRSKTHCKHGHEFTPENTRTDSRQRYCRACHRQGETKRREQRRSG